MMPLEPSQSVARLGSVRIESLNYPVDLLTEAVKQ